MSQSPKMAFENSCSTYLSLSSHLNEDQNPHNQNTQENTRKVSPSLKFDPVFPSLSLGLSQEEEKGELFYRSKASNSHSAVSSYSNSNVKREQEMISEKESEVERESSKVVSDDHDEDRSVRKKLRFTRQQSIILEDNFKEHSTLNPKQKQELAKQLSLQPRQVEVWFQNRRARTKVKLTELEYKAMKKRYETLTDENRRLQKELQELKAMKATAPFYLQIPAATLTMCTSCDTIGNSDEISRNSHLPKIRTKPRFYKTFSHPSAAC